MILLTVSDRVLGAFSRLYAGCEENDAYFSNARQKAAIREWLWLHQAAAWEGRATARVRMTSLGLQYLVQWIMCADPLPPGSRSEDGLLIREWLDRAARQGGFDDWVHAFHGPHIDEKSFVEFSMIYE